MADINAQFQQMLGRPATPDETAFLQKYIDEGNLQPGEIGTILQSHPEYQAKQLEQNKNSYMQALTANDAQTLQQGASLAGAQAQSRFAGLGRPNSSAMAAQVFGQTGQIANNLAQSRQSALANFYGNGMQNNASMASAQGQNTLNNAYGMQKAKMQRGWDIEDYNRQQNDYNNYLNAANRQRRNSALGGLGGTAIGAGLGFAAGGPVGGMIGAGMGGSLGGAMGGL